MPKIYRLSIKVYISMQNRFYDPSVSQKLTLEVIKENTNVPFSWLLPAFELVHMSKHDIEEWVYKAYENGAYSINTEIRKLMCENNNYIKIHEFINAAQKLGSIA